jgi:hypothetical protein
MNFDFIGVLVAAPLRVHVNTIYGESEIGKDGMAKHGNVQ